MLRPNDLPLPSELPALDDDPALFDPSPEWFVEGLKPSLHDDEGEEETDGCGFRALIDQPEALSLAWRTSSRAEADRSGWRVRPTKRRFAARSKRPLLAD